ncbi:MAG TPA: CPBP family intramembrane glutamic endopeptidase [Candidatus Rubrimentiphilum sp.]|nr:CPBP family intramembrane glutamic endopeptidase [Candidatus Rubrimentiphilum sp.]
MKILAVIVFAFLLVGITGGVWSFLLLENLRISPALPWCVPVMGILLWVLWQYLSGDWGPKRTAAYRSKALRANALPAPVFLTAAIAGLCAVLSLAGLWMLLSRLTVMPAHLLPPFSQYPMLTVALILLMSPLVNAIAEEAAFRGYVQGMLEPRIGGAAAISATALLMLPAHGFTQGFAWQVVLFYLLIDLVFGALAYLTDSIVPGIVTHAAGLLLFFTVIWPSPASRFSPWESTAAFAVFGLVSIVAYMRLARQKPTRYWTA